MARRRHPGPLADEMAVLRFEAARAERDYLWGSVILFGGLALVVGGVLLWAVLSG